MEYKNEFWSRLNKEKNSLLRINEKQGNTNKLI